MRPITRLIIPVLAYSQCQFLVFRHRSPKLIQPHLVRISGPTAGLGIDWRKSVLLVLPDAWEQRWPMAIEEWFRSRTDRFLEIREAEVLDGSWGKRYEALCCSNCGRLTFGESRWPGSGLAEVCQECWEQHCSESWWKMIGYLTERQKNDGAGESSPV